MSSNRSRKRKLKKRKKSNRKLITILALTIIAISIIFGYILLSSGSVKMKVLLETNKGNIIIKLRDDMPITTNNFKNLVKNQIYDGTIFHRVISDFMIQGGDPTGTGYGDPSIPNISDEFSKNPDNNKNLRGTIAMANTGAPNSGSSQFFINVVYNNHLDNHHPVFGEITEGVEIVDLISEVDILNDKPIEDVVILKATLID